MKEYIEREAAIHAVVKSFWSKPYISDVELAQAVRDAPAADVVERKRGEWVLGHVEPGYFTPGGNRPWICPECGQVVSWRLDKPKEKFCSECGADMRGVDHA